MRAFLPTLREIEGKLTVPIQDRIRILRELEFDLEELQDRLVAQGVPPEEAQSRAVEALVPEGIALEELGELHTPLYRRITHRFSDHHLRIVERSALALVSGSVLFAETLLLTRVDLLTDPSPFLWPVLGLGAVLLSAVLARGFQLWIKGDHQVLDQGFRGILTLSVAILGWGVGGTMFDLYRLAGTLERSPELAGLLAPQWLVRDCALLSVSVLLALAGGLTWFILTQWLTLVSRAHRDVLGLTDSNENTRKR